MSATIEFLGTVGWVAKYLDPSRPFSSAVTHKKRTERFKAGMRAMHRVRNVEHQRRSRAIVHGAVVNAIAVDRFADAEVVNVRGQDDVFILQLRIGARQFGDDIVGLHLFLDDLGFRVNAGGERKRRQRLAVFGQIGNLLEAVAGTLRTASLHRPD